MTCVDALWRVETRQVLGSRPVQAQADAKTKTITASHNNVKQFGSPGIPNEQYKPIVEEKTEILAKSVYFKGGTSFGPDLDHL